MIRGKKKKIVFLDLFSKQFFHICRIESAQDPLNPVGRSGDSRQSLLPTIKRTSSSASVN